MPGFTTYDQGRLREDVQDMIYNISPVDNPIASMAKTIRANGKKHEWTEDALATAAANRQIEGADATFSNPAALTALDNQCQIMTKTAQITGTLETVDKYGRDSEMAYQLMKRYMELANDEELAIMGAPGGTRQSKVVGDASTARQMQCLLSAVHANVTVDATGITTVAQLEAKILAAHQAGYTYGANPRFLSINPSKALYVAAFAAATGRNRDINNQPNRKVIVNAIDLYVSPFGELTVMLDRNQDTLAAFMCDPNYVATPVLRPTDDWAIAKTGDSEKRQILREGTVALLNIRSCPLVDNIPATLT